MFERKDPSLVTWSTTLTQHSVTLLKLLEETTDSTTLQHSHLTNYTVTVIAYNDVGTGPTSSEVIHQLLLIFNVLLIYCRTWCGIWSNTKWFRDTRDQYYMEYTHQAQWCHYHV